MITLCLLIIPKNETITTLFKIVNLNQSISDIFNHKLWKRQPIVCNSYAYEHKAFSKEQMQMLMRMTYTTIQVECKYCRRFLSNYYMFRMYKAKQIPLHINSSFIFLSKTTKQKPTPKPLWWSNQIFFQLKKKSSSPLHHSIHREKVTNITIFLEGCYFLEFFTYCKLCWFWLVFSRQMVQFRESCIDEQQY